MRIHATDERITISAPAKINLFLEVLGRRSDGFHDLETWMTPIGLFDTLHCRTSDSRGIDLNVTSAAGSQIDFADVPRDDRNLVVRAVDELRRDQDVSAGLSIRLHKRIPTQAGLGGGSSDAAAALVAANHIWKLNLPTAALAELSARIGSDIPFFFTNGPAICRGRGERIQPLVAKRRVPIVMVKPSLGLKTATIFKHCQISTHPVSLPCLNSQTSFSFRLFNRLQFAVEELYPQLTRIARVFAQCGVAHHLMTGSGSAYFGIPRNRRDSIRVAHRIRQANLGQVFFTHCMI